jgi:hypothetical protein
LDVNDSGESLVVVPIEIQLLLDQYKDIFVSKVVFPPKKSRAHSISLVPRGTLFHIRPYRYAPMLKDEIEHQVKEMLEAGLIQHSSNPFSSPMLLVKKKDGTYDSGWMTDI